MSDSLNTEDKNTTTYDNNCKIAGHSKNGRKLKVPRSETEENSSRVQETGSKIKIKSPEYNEGDSKPTKKKGHKKLITIFSLNIEQNNLSERSADKLILDSPSLHSGEFSDLENSHETVSNSLPLKSVEPIQDAGNEIKENKREEQEDVCFSKNENKTRKNNKKKITIDSSSFQTGKSRDLSERNASKDQFSPAGEGKFNGLMETESKSNLNSPSLPSGEFSADSRSANVRRFSNLSEQSVDKLENCLPFFEYPAIENSPECNE